MRKNLMSVIAPFVLIAPLAFSSGRKEATSIPEKGSKTESEYVTLKGNVYDECYMPASAAIGGNYESSRYSFAMLIQESPSNAFGPTVIKHKSFKVIPTNDIPLESVNAIIDSEHRTTVEVQVKREEADKQFITVTADKLRVPEQN